jgi:hypothetical protein
MQTKNTIKQSLFLILALFIGEGVFGFGLFWPLLLIMKDKKWIYWVAFFSGVFLSIIYSQDIGLMSLYLVTVITLTALFMGGARGFGKWVILVSVLVSSLFDFCFGLPFGIWEMIVIAVVGFFASKLFETNETISINF